MHPNDSRAHDGVDTGSLLAELETLRASILDESGAAQSHIDAVHPDYRDSAENLLHYLALRRHELRPLQRRLAALGLSSLGRAESHVLASLDAVLGLLRRLKGKRQAPDQPRIGFERGGELLETHTHALLGATPTTRTVRIMVTMPASAADDYPFVRRLVDEGMDCARINCAHDDAAVWERIVNHVRRAAEESGRPCEIAMDLGGPKLRTGPLEPGPQVLRVRPQRDVLGRVTACARIWLSSSEQPAPVVADASFQVAAPWLAGIEEGDGIRLTDARGAHRVWRVVDVSARGCWAEADQTAYVAADTLLRHRRSASKGKGKSTRLQGVPVRENVIRLEAGEQLVITRDLTPGHPALTDSAGQLLRPATIGCTLPEVFDSVQPGEPICFDDGKIGAVIDSVDAQEVRVRITRARPGGAKLRADKGINLPDSALALDALTAKDIDDLDFVARHADIVELSFANRAEDVAALQEHLRRLGRPELGIVLKIETRRAFENLPDMLLTAMRSPCCGVMIARGDLAVETGFERLAEVQEEMLWVCEAAHVPVIWATQVLESLAQQGLPTRAEITDAAMGDRAECVMLNKGPHVLDAVRVLDDILRRMQAHQDKKHPMLRVLRLADALPRLGDTSN